MTAEYRSTTCQGLRILFPAGAVAGTVVEATADEVAMAVELFLIAVASTFKVPPLVVRFTFLLMDSRYIILGRDPALAQVPTVADRTSEEARHVSRGL